MESKQKQVSLMGVPYDLNSSFRRGPQHGPAAIRAVLTSDANNGFAEAGLEVLEGAGWIDRGDLGIARHPSDAADEAIEKAAGEIIRECPHLVSLGGDHSVTFPILRALAGQYKDINILHIDAHPDLYDELDGNRFSHACPFARIMEGGYAVRLVQLGIRTLNSHQQEQAERYGVEVHEMKDWDGVPHLEFEGPVYMSIDLDGIDPAFAPGVSHHEPGGLTARDVLKLLQTFKGRLIGGDIVELNPSRDVHDMTSTLAAKLTREMISRIIRDNDLT